MHFGGLIKATIAHHIDELLSINNLDTVLIIIYTLHKD